MRSKALLLAVMAGLTAAAVGADTPNVASRPEPPKGGYTPPDRGRYRDIKRSYSRQLKDRLRAK